MNSLAESYPALNCALNSSLKSPVTWFSAYKVTSLIAFTHYIPLFIAER